MDLALGGLGVLVKHAPRFPVRDADSGQAEPAMPSPDPDVLAAEDGSPPDDLLYLLYRAGEPRELGATVREWHDTAVTMARMAEDVRAAGLGGVGNLIDAGFAGADGKTVTRTDARLRISGPDRYRVDYLRRADRSGLQVNACDGERYWRVFPDRILTGPAAPLGTQAAYLIYTGWLLRCRMSGARDLTYRGRRARQLRVTRGPGTEYKAGPLTYFPADAIVDAETGCLLRLISYIGDAPPPGGNSTTSAPNPLTRTTSGCTSRPVRASWRKPAIRSPTSPREFPAWPAPRPVPPPRPSAAPPVPFPPPGASWTTCAATARQEHAALITVAAGARGRLRVRGQDIVHH